MRLANVLLERGKSANIAQKYQKQIWLTLIARYVWNSTWKSHALSPTLRTLTAVCKLLGPRVTL